METVINILSQFGVSLLGMLLYTFLAFQRFLNLTDLKSSVFWESVKSEYGLSWKIHTLVSVVIVLIIVIIVNVVPKSDEAIQSVSGLAVATEIASFLTLGFTVLAGKDSKK
ncbi:hypothetical protein [uncultured Winogradskyella sp.]|uniref:hypothetical protein n=1 Tax=uncultured Winogradskyella sp. TaxID=395353 RepID=UPI0026110EE4|nr:hypothetical protein [uncultured Winogradskyella sp.]